MGTLKVFDAENGVDGLDMTAVNVPAIESQANGNGAFRRFSSAAAMTGRLGYHFNVVSGQNSYVRVDITDSKVQAFRGCLRVLNTTTQSRRMMQWRIDTGGTDTYAMGLVLLADGRLQIQDTNTITIGTIATLTPGVAYDISVACTVGASTNDSQVTAKLYLLNSDTQVGSTVSSSTANLTNSFAGNAAMALESVYFGCADTSATDIGIHWDLLRFENDRGEFPAPIAASATMIINSTLTAGAAKVPYVRDPQLGLEE